MKVALYIFFLLLSGPFVMGQTADAAQEEEIKELIVDSFQEIFSNMDAEKISDYFTDDFLLLEHGEVWDNEIIRGYLEQAKGQGQMPERINSFDFIEVKISGNMAWTAYHNKAIFKMGDEVLGEMNWLESASAILTADGWRLQLLHSTIVENP